ncbi:MAG: hypothetical protein Q9187_008521 [Circinaria calcarea]
MRISDGVPPRDAGTVDWGALGAEAFGGSNNMRQGDKQTSPTGPDFDNSIGPTNEPGHVRALSNEDETDPTSHAALSNRAEEILANAKKRLLEMEDNLSRARHSLKNQPSTTIPATTDLMPHRIPGTLQEYRSKDHQDLTLTSPRRTSSARSPGNIAGHSRYFSETSIPDSAEKQRSTRDQRRVSSAMGVVGVNIKSEERPVNDANGESQDRSLDSLNHSVTRQKDMLWPLEENSPWDTPPDMSSPYGISPFGSEESRRSGRGRVSPKTSYFSSKHTESNELTRSRSTMQLRDLREQMQELRGKVTSLKQRTREDRLQRRSLQTLKTPTPFTVAPNWTEESAPGEQAVETGGLVEDEYHSIQAIAPADAQPRQGPASPAQDQQDRDSSMHPEPTRNKKRSSKLGHPNFTTVPNDRPNRDLNPGPNTPVKPLVRKELPSPHEEKHEDRPDAFDYEHFFLHSGMLTPGRTPPSRTQLERRYSHSSSDSAETTKANEPESWTEPSAVPRNIPHLPTKNGTSPSKNPSHFRQNSVDSISTTATFATATENSETNREHPLWNSTQSQPADSRRPRANSSKDQRVQNGTYLTFPAASRHQYSNPTPPFSPTQALASSFPLPPSPLPRRTSSSSPSKSFSPSSSSSSSPSHVLHTLLSSSNSKLGATDLALVERLLAQLQTVCKELCDEIGGSGSGNGNGKSRYERRVWRRRVDAARRVLEGEMD